MIFIATENLLNSQLNYEIIKFLNEKNKTDNVGCFIRNLSNPFMNCNFPVLNSTKMFSGYHNGTIIATCLDTAEMLSNCNNKARKIFYVYELEFLRNKNFLKNVNIYRSLELYTRSKSYKSALENYCNKEVKIGDLWMITQNTL